MPVLDLLTRFTYPAIFGLLVACGLGAPLSEDLILLTTGGLVARGLCSAAPAIAVALAGVIAGDLALYGIGKRLGRRALGHPRLAAICPKERVDAVAARFERWGALAIFGARFVAGMRACTFLAAGLLGIRARRFLAADLLAALIWVPGVILLARAGVAHLHGTLFLAVLRRGLEAVALGAVAGLLARLFSAQLAPPTSIVAPEPELEDARR